MGKSKKSGKEMREVGDLLEDYIHRKFATEYSAGSGAVRGDGDQIGDLFHIESKATEDTSVSIKLSIWQKILQEAQTYGKYPLYIAGFVDSLQNKVKTALVVTDIDYLVHVLRKDVMTKESIETKVTAVVRRILGREGLPDSTIGQVEDAIRQVCQEQNTL